VSLLQEQGPAEGGQHAQGLGQLVAEERPEGLLPARGGAACAVAEGGDVGYGVGGGGCAGGVGEGGGGGSGESRHAWNDCDYYGLMTTLTRRDVGE
jgi:hypothetical protein